MTWLLPPALEWAKFLRLLRHPAPPRGWLEAAAELEDLQKRPLLLRWIAQHPKSPAHLRARLLPRLPWRALAAVAQDASAHPQARAQASERLKLMWVGLSLGERRALASQTPKLLWVLVWKDADEGVIKAFLKNPRLYEDALLGLLHPPILPTHLSALESSRWKEQEAVARRVLEVLDHSFDFPGCEVVLGQAAFWIRALSREQRLVVSTALRYPALRRMVRAHSEAMPDGLPL